MVTLNEYLGGKVNKRKKLIPQNKEELKSIIKQRLKESPDLDLNDIDVSKVDDMEELFIYMNVSSIDISRWDIDMVDEYMFYKCETLKSVILPDSVKNIGFGAFAGCSRLIEINIPDSVESIGNGAFEFCRKLTKINISDSVKSIEQYVFSHCNSLIEINIPNSVESIGDGTFEFCSKLTKINISDSVKSIGDYAFYKCNKLTDTTIPNSVKIIGCSAFYEVPHITYHGPATWESDNEYWGAKSMN